MELPAFLKQEITNPSKNQADRPDKGRHVRLKEPEDAHHTGNA
tara:strand:+ start:187 stop:315 length:129 start_codon:yes stop_codon:yes gene_type:complete